MPPALRKVAMTQPNPGPAPAAPDPNQNPTQDPATGPATQPTATPPAPPGFQPASGDPAPDGEGNPTQPADQPADQLGEGGKKALAAEREARKAAEKATAEQAAAHTKQLADLQKQLKELQPAAELFAQFRKAAVPEADKTDLERLQEELTQVQNETKAERQARWRLEIATDKGLTREQAEELRGETHEELSAHADRLLKLFPKASPPPPPPPPAETDAATEPASNGQQPAAQPEPTTAGPKPDPSQGARGPVDIHAQIQDAMAKGDIRTSIALKQQLAAQQRGGNQ